MEVLLLPALPEAREPDEPAEPEAPEEEPDPELRVAEADEPEPAPVRVELDEPVARAVPLTRAVPLPAPMADAREELAELRVAIKDPVALPARPVTLAVGAEVIKAPPAPEVALAIAELAAEGFAPRPVR